MCATDLQYKRTIKVYYWSFDMLRSELVKDFHIYELQFDFIEYFG